MQSSRRRANRVLLAAATGSLMGFKTKHSSAATADDLQRDADQTLKTLYKQNATAQLISDHSKATLVFPKIIKAGLVFGGSYGEGVLLKAGRPAAYYNSISASWGFQAGAESFSYVLFLMSDEALTYLDESKGWELGVGPTVVAVNEGIARNLSSSTLRDDVYAFILDQQGLMASLSIEGTKISRIFR